MHWRDVLDRVLFKLAVTVHQCLNGRAPAYLSEHCIPVSSADTRRHLRSANRHLLAVPRFRLNTYGRRAFSVAGPISSTDCLGVYLKRTCSRDTSASSALGVLHDNSLFILYYANRQQHSNRAYTVKTYTVKSTKHTKYHTKVKLKAHCENQCPFTVLPRTS